MKLRRLFARADGSGRSARRARARLGQRRTYGKRYAWTPPGLPGVFQRMVQEAAAGHVSHEAVTQYVRLSADRLF